MAPCTYLLLCTATLAPTATSEHGGAIPSTARGVVRRGIGNESSRRGLQQCPPGTEDLMGTGDWCISCPPGRYDDDNNPNTFCNACSPGQVAEGGTTFCVDCPNGTFARAGTYNAQSLGLDAKFLEAGTGCFQCPTGRFSEAVADHCEICRSGWYDHDSNPSTPCVICHVGSYAASGRTQCEDCAPGRFDHDRRTDTPCAACSIGTYANYSAFGTNRVEELQRKADAGNTAAQKWLTTLHPPRCATERRFEIPECVQAARDLELLAFTSCEECEPGQHDHDQNPATPCEYCDPGKVSWSGLSVQHEAYDWAPPTEAWVGRGSWKSHHCEACTAGMYARYTDPSCTDCLGGSYTPNDGMAYCEICEKGTMSEDKASSCIICETAERNQSFCAATSVASSTPLTPADASGGLLLAAGGVFVLAIFCWKCCKKRKATLDMRRASAQLRALTIKTLILLMRKRSSSLLYIAFPSLLILGLFVLHATLVEPPPMRDGQTAPLRVRRCEVFDLANQPVDGATCVTALFAPMNANTTAIMQYFAAANGLKYGVDVTGVATPEDIAMQVAHRPGSVDSGIVFRQSSPDSLQLHSYELWVNNTFATTFGGSVLEKWSFGQDEEMYHRSGIQGHYAAVHQAIDAAIVGHIAGLSSSADIQLDVGRFPELVTAADLIQDNRFTWTRLSILLPIGCVCSAVQVSSNVAAEKDAKLLSALRQVGLHEWTYWTSWVTGYMAPCCVAAAMYTVVGNALKIPTFTYCSISVHFVAMFLFLQSLAAQATFLASFVSKQRKVASIGILMVLITSWMALNQRNNHYHYLRFSEAQYDDSPWLFLTLMPSFHYYRIYTAIDGRVDPRAGVEFKFENLGDAAEYDCRMTRANDFCGLGQPNGQESVLFQEYSLGASLLIQVMLVVLYNVFAWWAGQVFASEEGSTRRAWFCVLPSYWGCGPQRRVVPNPDADSIALEQSKSSIEQSLRIWKLSKLYEEKEAIKELTMKIESSRCVAMLGQNGTCFRHLVRIALLVCRHQACTHCAGRDVVTLVGTGAGKSTLIKCLSGAHAPTYGKAFIFGLDVQNEGNQQKLQQISGVCPQDDFLFPQLTAREHLRLYGAFKEVPDVEAHCDKILHSVDLFADADSQTITFSGGMKRRLSVGIASVAGPRILFLDEPTTGVDPLCRRRVWNTIQELKLQRILILTTHSMEEADALGDTIAIIHNGKLRATGSPLFLKSRYGKGHTVSLLSKPSSSARVVEIVKSCIPAAEVVSSDAGNTAVSLPRVAMKRLPRLLASLMAEDQLIDNWGVSNTTLEEVFLRLCASDAVNAAVEGTGIDNIARVKIVQRSVRDDDNGLDSQDSVLCVLETYHADDIVVISPEDTDTTETIAVPDQGAQEDSSAGDKERRPRERQKRDRDRERETHTHRDSESERDTDAPIQRETLIETQSDTQRRRDPMDESAIDGDLLPAGGVSLPLPPPPLNEDNDSKPVHLCTQAIAIAWKDSVRSCYCRKSPGCSGRLPPKCFLPYFCVSWVVAMVAFQVQTIRNYQADLPSSVFCSNGVYTEFREEYPDAKNLACNFSVLAQSIVDTASRSIGSCVEMTASQTCWQSIEVGGNCGAATADIWFTNAPDVAPGWTAFENISLFPSESQTLQFTDYRGVTTTFREIDDIWSRIMAAQSRIQSSSRDGEWGRIVATQSQTQATCEITTTNTISFARESFPYLALQIARSELSSAEVTFHYTVMHWSSQPGQQFKYTEIRCDQCCRFDTLPVVHSCIAGPGLDCRLPQFSREYCEADDAEADTVVHNVISLMTNSILRTVAPGAAVSMTVVPMPELSFVAPYNPATVQFWALMFPLLTSLQQPVIAYMLSLEREIGLLEMIQIAGGRKSAQLLGTWVVCFSHFAVFSGWFVLTMELSGASAEHRIPAGPLVVMIFSWAWAQSGFVMFLSLSCCRKATHASAIATLSVAIASTCSVILTETLLFRPMALAGYLLPPLAYARTIGVLLHFGSSEEFVRGAVMLWVDGCLYTALTAAHVHWPGSSVWRLFKSLNWAPNTPNHVNIQAYSEDESVSRERARVCGPDPASNDAAVVMKRLVKHFPAISSGKRITKRAVDELCLAIDTAEIFGLLGPNGAGKSTIISVLTGQLKSDGGSATVCGFDVRTQLRQVNEYIAVCPQFDRVWPGLTVEHHLKFYALLNGVPRSQALTVARQMAQKVALDGDAFGKPAESLSGGMKRRLSIAIALCGDSPVKFFDEPTTGLDPETRRDIWSMIKAERRKKSCLVITTHSMEEADALCDRIGIVTGGRLRCLGTPLHLKNTFGDGFKVTCSVGEHEPEIAIPARRRAVMVAQLRKLGIESTTVDTMMTDAQLSGICAVDELMRSICHDAQLVGVFTHQSTYILPCADVAQVFSCLEDAKHAGVIAEWGISQASMEDVFIKAATKFQDESSLAAWPGGADSNPASADEPALSDPLGSHSTMATWDSVENATGLVGP